MKETQLEFGKALRDVGIEVVLHHTPESYKDRANRAICKLIKMDAPFSAEDVRELSADPPHPNALGAVMITAIRAGLIQPVGWTKAKRSGSHARNIQLYRGTPTLPLE